VREASSAAADRAFANAIGRPLDLSSEKPSVQIVYDGLLNWFRISRTKGKRFAHPTVKQIIEKCVRRLADSTARLALDKLVELGVIARRDRTGRASRYFLTPPKIGDQIAGSDRSDRRKSAGALYKDQEKEKQENSSSAAAADIFASAEQYEAAQALYALDFPEGLIERYVAMRGPTFALLFATYCAELKRSGFQAKDWTRFIRGGFHHPTKYEIRFANGQWHLPPIAGGQRVKTYAEQMVEAREMRRKNKREY
jgi:hypothetical protein